MSEWISVKDRLPPKECPFLALSNGDIISSIWEKDIERYIPNCGCTGWEHEWGKIAPSHWMPLPDPPKEAV